MNVGVICKTGVPEFCALVRRRFGMVSKTKQNKSLLDVTAMNVFVLLVMYSSSAAQHSRNNLGRPLYKLSFVQILLNKQNASMLSRSVLKTVRVDGTVNFSR